MCYKKDGYQETVNTYECTVEKCSMLLIIQFQLESSSRKPITVLTLVILHAVYKPSIMDKTTRS